MEYDVYTVQGQTRLQLPLQKKQENTIPLIELKKILKRTSLSLADLKSGLMNEKPLSNKMGLLIHFLAVSVAFLMFLVVIRVLPLTK